MAEHYTPPGNTQQEKKHDWLSFLGMAAVAGAAAFTSYSGLAGLAEMAGWHGAMARFLPITIDAYAMTATRVWLSPANLTDKARRFARRSAVGTIIASVVGNALFHAASAHVLPITWPMVIGISAVPPIALSLITHLYHTSKDTKPEPAKPEPNASPGPAIAEPETVRAAYPILGSTGPGASGRSASRDASRPAPRSASAGGANPIGTGSRKPLPAAPRDADKSTKRTQQLDQARAADTAHREATGKPISARKLAEQLHVHQSTAGELLRELKAAPVPAASPRPAPAPAPTASSTQPQPAATRIPAPTPTASDAPSATAPPAASDALPGSVPGPRPAPVEHANGAETAAP